MSHSTSSVQKYDNDQSVESDARRETLVRPRRVLSIQSHVVSGYVGNKAATFPLQILGFDVDPLNSVHFSNHTGHPEFSGQILDGQELCRIINSLESNRLMGQIGHILTGYVGSASFLKKVGSVISTLKQKAAENCGKKYAPPRFICDPVMGDGGKLYVPLELVQIYKEIIIPLADVVTPNQTEVEFITGIKLKNSNDAVLACESIHALGPDLVVITSIDFLEGNEGNKMFMFGSRRLQGNKFEIYQVDIPRIPGKYTGTGDLCAAILLAHTSSLMNPASNNKSSEFADTCTSSDTPEAGTKEENILSLADVLQKVAATMFSVIKRTFDFSCLTQTVEDTSQNGKSAVRFNELRLIQSKNDIENSPTVASIQVSRIR